MRVDEPGRDDGAAEILGAARARRPRRPRRRARPRSGSSRARARCPRRPSSRPRRSPRITRPPAARARSGRRRRGRGRSASGVGITDSARNASMLERRLERRSRARAPRRSARVRRARRTSASGASESRPGDRQRQLGEHLGAVDDDDAAADGSRAGAPRTAIAASLIPTTTTLCASCATVDASAPRCRPKPRTKPSPMRPVPRCRSTTAILARSRVGIGERLAGAVRSARRRATPSRSGPARSRSRAPSPPVPRDAEHLGAERADPHRVAHPVRHLRARGSPPPDRPRLSTISGTKRSRSGRSEQVGLVAGRDRAEVREPVPERRAERRADERVLGRDARTRPRRAPSS